MEHLALCGPREGAPQPLEWGEGKQEGFLEEVTQEDSEKKT